MIKMDADGEMDPARLPDVSVHLASLSSYDVLVESSMTASVEVAA